MAFFVGSSTSHRFLYLYVFYRSEVVNSVVNILLPLCTKPVHFRPCRSIRTMCVVIQRHGDIGVSHDILQCIWVHSFIRHIRTESVTECMRCDVR